MSDNRSRHDRLAVRLSLIISRLMAGESLSLKTLSDEFGVTERTLQRDFHQRLVHLDLEYRNGRYSLRRQSSPGAIPEMLSFIQNTGIARILPLRNGRLITCLTDNQEPSPSLIWLPAPDITATFPECFSQLILAIRQCIHISLMTERWYPSLEPCRLIYYSGSWYLIALQKGKLQVFPLADIKSVSLTSERFERRGHIHSLVAEERFISALPHFSFIHKLINTFNL
ncbi:TPA: helix-turn-helix transcriptional regulator [Escherichia coli]